MCLGSRIRIILVGIWGILLPFSGCDSNRLESVPQEMKGEWRTSAHKYKGFSFEISEDSLAFIDENAADPMEIYPISKIEKDPEAPNLYVITYRTKEGEEYKFSFYFSPSHGGSITLKNQRKYTWKRAQR